MMIREERARNVALEEANKQLSRRSMLAKPGGANQQLHWETMRNSMLEVGQKNILLRTRTLLDMAQKSTKVSQAVEMVQLEEKPNLLLALPYSGSEAGVSTAYPRESGRSLST